MQPSTGSQPNGESPEDKGATKGLLGGNFPGLHGEPTPLRPVLKMARESVNSMADRVSIAKTSASETVDHVLGTGKAHMGMTLSRIGVDVSYMDSFDDFRRMHPRFLICSTTALVAIPSLIRRRFLLRNTALAAGAASAVAYGPEWWARRHPK